VEYSLRKLFKIQSLPAT